MQKISCLLLALISLPTLAEPHHWRAKVAKVKNASPWTVTLQVLPKAPTISDYRTPKADKELVCEKITFRFDIQTDSLVDALRHKMTKLNYKTETERAIYFLESHLDSQAPFHFQIFPNQSTSTRLIGCEIHFSRLNVDAAPPESTAPVLTIYNNAL
ncbi:hypothetical protein JCM19237_3144 [Photobacterium aphoticum]|uniref:Uncharacterized protein n=1 Tax=Photobacterium aphoticum TaxID=754436 RepID=A0A090QZK6_9GAMM|nr:hypothetical protein JCM19237_3144 [Photobacterium aphoticum]